MSLVESPLGLFIEDAPAALAIFDRKMRYVHASSGWRRDFGLGDRDLRGLSHYEIFPEIPDRWKEVHRRGLLGEVLYEDRDKFQRADGRVQWLRWKVRPWYESKGSIAGIVIFTEDISARVRAEEALRLSEERYRCLVEATSDIVWNGEKLEDGMDVPQWRELTGQTIEQAGVHWTECIHPEDRDAIALSWLEFTQRGGTFKRQYRVRCRDGQYHWIAVNGVSLHHKDGTIREWIGTFNDITERLRAEEALRGSEERLRLAQEVAQIGSFDRNMVTGEANWSSTLAGIYGLRPGQFPRTDEEYLQLIHPEDRAYVSDLLAESRRCGDGAGEWRTLGPDGTVRWVTSKWRVSKDDAGNPVRSIGCHYDITERKLIEAELQKAKERLTEEKLYLEQEIDSQLGAREIIGSTSGLKHVMEDVAAVAPTDSNVLLLGETGTGKEVIARAIHENSKRAGRSFIKVNCAAIPSGLLESELFGAERGAFTGAFTKKIGRIELADGGTLFLDEIGEILPSLQPKLLRVLQEQEFERLGGTRTLKVDFRLIAATNRDLPSEVRNNHFRSDLYYRISVFPISLPPLRERVDDIPALVEHFVQKCARRMGKTINSIPRSTMDTLQAWVWAGNIRELENFVERSVILTSGSVLAAPLGMLQEYAVHVDGPKTVPISETLASVQREHIVEALRKSKGRISGPQGAAVRLGLKRSTLQSKMKQMGINP